MTPDDRATSWATAPTKDRGGLRPLRLTLALWMLPTVIFLFLSSAWLTRVTTAQLADSAYDRSLNGALRAIEANISTKGGGVGVELPYPLFQSLQATAAGTVYFRVTTDDGLVEIGDSGLPAPPVIASGAMRFYDALYLGQSVRVGALRRPLPDNRTVLIEVAETTASRQGFLAQVGRAAMWRDLVTTLFGLALMMLGVNAAMRPLSALRDRFARRAANDLSPVDDRALPAELRPLAQTFNATLARHSDLALAQRRFLDGAAHQLRTPLSILRMQLDYALAADTAQERLDALQSMRPVIDRASHTATQMLALARADAFFAIRQETALQLDLRTIAEQVARLHLPAARLRQIRLELDLPEAPLSMRGDETLLYEALSNLLDNALRHTPARGRVLVSLGGPDPVSITISDDGPGMPPDRLPSIGERFITTQGASGQSGLGLSIAMTVARAHGGTLHAQNRPEGGFAVTITLPAPASP